MTNRLSRRSLLFASLLLVAGCGPKPAAEPAASSSTPSSTTAPSSSEPAAAAPNTELQGKITIDGSSTVFPISEAAASQFQKQYPTSVSA